MRFPSTIGLMSVLCLFATAAGAQVKAPEEVLKEKELTKLGLVYVLPGDAKSIQAAQAIRNAQQQLDSESRKRADLRGQIRNANAMMQKWAADYRASAAQMESTPKNSVRIYNELVTR